MAGVGRLLVHWAPHDKDSFYVGADAIKLYRIKPRDKVEDKGAGNEHHQFSLTAVESDVPGGKEIIKCIAATPHADENQFIAVGTSAGRTVLVDFMRPENKVVKEFVPRFPRVANCLAWNPFHRAQVACGLDKVRNDYCTLIWDITYSEADAGLRGSAKLSMPVGGESRLNLGQAWRPDSVTRAFREYTNSESSCALQWKPDEPSILACGTGAKWLRVYDLRQNSTFSQSYAAHAKAVNGVAYNIHNTYQLATHSDDSIVKIWDTRNPDRCFYSFSAGSSPIGQIAWSPTRRSLLSTISNQENCIRLWDLRNIEFEVNNNEAYNSEGKGRSGEQPKQQPHHSKMNRVVHTSESLAAMEWHPRESLVVLTVGANSGSVSVKRISEYTPIAWGARGVLQVASGQATAANLSSKCKDITTAINMPTSRPRGSSAGTNSFEIESSMRPPANHVDDISCEMRVRAKMGYQFNMSRNIEILAAREGVLSQTRGIRNAQRGSAVSVSAASEVGSQGHSEGGGQELSGVWHWLKHVMDVLGQPAETQLPLKSCGIYSIISGYQDMGAPPEGRTRSLSLDQDPKSVVQTVTGALPSFPVYTSASRVLALRICGWACEGPGRPIHLDEILSEIKNSGDYERAAAVALFHNKLGIAIDCLVDGAETMKQRAAESIGNSLLSQQAHSRSNELQMIALSLSGYNETGPSPLWKEACEKFRNSYSNPYVKCSFSFLARLDNDKDYKSILNNSEILFSDRIAFACRFLTDQKLVEFLETMHTSAVRSGRLGGLLLTGLSQRGVDLVEQYINHTGDVQTAAILMSFVVPRFFTDERVIRWMEEYRSLLDQWQLWHERASLDVERIQTTKTKPPTQIYARCNFCNQSLSQETAQGRGKLGGSARMMRTGAAMAQIPKVSSCPQCRKPLPRCNLCSLVMGTGLAPPTDSPLVANATENLRSARPNIWKTDSSSFEHWMTWCQTCRHGGHAFHLLEWFKTHTTCPVAGCQCSCMSKDHIARERYDSALDEKKPSWRSACGVDTNAVGSEANGSHATPISR